MEYNRLFELIKNRRSIRKFKPDAFPADYVEKIIDAGCQAPSGFNMQPWEFVVIRNSDLKKKIVELFPPLPRANVTNDFRAAPAFIILLGDPRAKAGLPDFLASNDKINEPIFISSLANAFLYMALAATSLGLTCQWLSVASSPPVQSGITQLIGIPEPYRIYDMMALGYPAAEATPKPLKKKEAIFHKDYCEVTEFSSDEDIANFAKKTKKWSLSRAQIMKG